MIKVIEGYELKRATDTQPLFLKVKSYAMTFPAFISAEHINSMKGSAISTGAIQRERPWWLGGTGEFTAQTIDTTRGSGLLVSEPRITMYEVVPTSTWVYTGVKP